jgi:hypothetical protein
VSGDARANSTSSTSRIGVHSAKENRLDGQQKLHKNKSTKMMWGEMLLHKELNPQRIPSTILDDDVNFVSVEREIS